MGGISTSERKMNGKSPALAAESDDLGLAMSMLAPCTGANLVQVDASLDATSHVRLIRELQPLGAGSIHREHGSLDATTTHRIPNVPTFICCQTTPPHRWKYSHELRDSSCLV